MKIKKLPITSYQLLVIVILCGLIIPNLSQAQILPACTSTGNCGICDFLDTFINILQWLLGIVAGATLMLMVWHGFTWITAGGSSEKVESGKKGITHAIFGMLIVLAAWQLVNIIIVILVNPPDGVSKNLFNGPKAWHEYCSTDNVCQGKGVGSPCGNGKFCRSSASGMSCGTGESEVFIGGGYGTITAGNACEFWATYPATGMGGTNPYSGYACQPQNDCSPYETLGSAYCPQSGNIIKSCCLKNSQLEAQPAQ